MKKLLPALFVALLMVLRTLGLMLTHGVGGRIWATPRLSVDHRIQDRLAGVLFLARHMVTWPMAGRADSGCRVWLSSELSGRRHDQD